MKKLFFTCLSLVLFGTTCLWGATRGKYTLDKTTTTIATENGWESGKKDLFNLNTDLKYTGFSDNATLQNPAYGQASGVKGARVYESRNSVASTISGTNVWIDSVKFLYSTNTTGVLCSSKDTVGGVVPGSSGTIYNSGTMYKVDAASFSFYSGRTSTGKSNGRCDIYNWTVVYYKLPTQITLASTMTVAVGNTFQIGQVSPMDSYYEWSSSNTDVLTIDQNGIITAKATGKSNVKVTSKNNIEQTCVVTVIANEGEPWEETFSNAEVPSTNVTKDVVGDSAVYNWHLTRFTRANNDNYKVDGKLGLYLRYDNKVSGSSIASKGNLEGGIKAVSFKWKPANTSNEVHFTVTVNGVKYVYYTPALQSAVWTTYQREFGVTNNADFSFSLDTLRSPQQAYEYISPISITPYLLYTKKSAEVYASAGAYTNTALINNTGTTPDYSISCGSDTAEIDANGAVTIKKSATVTVTASWNAVSTTYTLIMHAKPAPVITFADQNVDMNQAPFTPTPTEAPSGIGTASYSSSDKSVVKVDAASGQLTIVGQGSAVIYVHYAEGTDYAEADVQYNVTVTDPMEKAVTELFTTEKIASKAELDTIYGNVAAWEYKFIRRDITQSSNPDTLRNGKRASRLQNIDAVKSPESYLLTTEPLEGGIKRVSFLWNNESPWNPSNHNFIIAAGENDKDTVIKAVTLVVGRLTDPDITYNHNFFVKNNVKLSIYNNSGSYALIGDIKITPYIYYTRKDTTVLAKAYTSETLINNEFINNTGTEGKVTYSIEEGKSAIAEILDENSGAVTIHSAGTVKVIATWSEGATTSYTLNILKEKPTVTLEGATIDAFGSYTPAPVAKLNGVDIENPVYSYKSSNEYVATITNSGVVTIHGIGTTNIRAILAEGDNYRSDSVEAVLTVTEPVGENLWKETFDSVPDISDYITSTQTYYGNKAVYWWQMRKFQHSKSGNTDKVGSEQGIRIKFDSKNNNYIASNRVEEGGIQAVFFNWCLAGSGTATATFSRIAPKNDASHSKNDTLNIVRENVSKGYNNVNSYVEELNIDKNTRFQVRIPSGDEAVVFGPITIKPYLLYTTKDTTVAVLDYKDKQTLTNAALINNTGVELGEDGITYSIKSVTPAGAAEILEANKHNGQVTINGAGTAVVQAKWEDVTTTYTLNISGGDLVLSFAKSHIDTTMNAETVTNELSGVKTGAGALTYTSDNERVAKVNKSTGVVSAMGPGDATITANVAAGTIYKAASTSFTIHVDEVTDPKEKKISESFPDYTGSPWLMSAIADPDTIIGEQGLWEVSYARHNAAKDQLTNERAVWLNTNGYITTLWEFGGVKRVKFVYNKKKISNRFSVIAGDIKDTVYAETMGAEYTYCHNFFLKKDATLKIHNICATAENNQEMLLGTIVITPYLYYTKKNDTIKAADWQEYYYNPKFLINNTNDDQHIIYSSSNPTAAEVMDDGQIDVHAAAAEPVIITAKWKTSETDSIVTSFSLFIQDKDKRKASFASDSISVERGDTAVNTLNIIPVLGDTDPVVEYVSSDPKIAKIADDKKTVIALSPGTVTITAQIGETKKSLAGSASYVLTVTYTPEEGTYWKETFSKCTSEGGTGAGVKADVEGDDGLKNWQLIKFQRRNPDDKVGDEQGIQVRYSGEITSKNALEGGIKEVVFNWRPFNTAYAPHFYVQAGDSIDTISHAAVLDAAKVIPYAHEFKQKNNAILKIGNFAQETPNQQGFVEVGVIKVIPYLLYKRKDTTLVAKDMAATNYKFFNNQLYNNIDEGTVSYSVKAKDNAVTMDGDSIRIIGAGIDTIQAAWEGVKTTYVVRVNLEDANLTFEKAKDTVLLKTETYQQVATTASSGATIKYELEGEHGAATIDPSSGVVTFNEYTGKLTILATVPVALPYNLDTARYELQVNNLETPTVIFNDTIVDMNSIPFVRPAQSIPASGMGQAHYSSNNLKVATVEKLTGLITIVGADTARIFVHYDEGTEWGEKDVNFLLTVTDPMDDAIIENFKDTVMTNPNSTVKTMTGVVSNWDYLYIRRHAAAPSNPDTLRCGQHGSRMQDVGEGHSAASYIRTSKPLEGGVKRVSFKWNKLSPNACLMNFNVSVGSTVDNVTKTLNAEVGRLNAEDITYNHNFNIKENAVLSIDNNCVYYTLIGDIKVTPYLRFKGNKQVSIDVDNVKSFNLNDSLINNTDEGEISFTVTAYTDVEPTITDGVVDLSNVKKGGVITIKASWEEVETTFDIHATVTPTVSFDNAGPVNKTVGDAAFTNALIPMDGLGKITYSSLNTSVATVNENSGLVTLVSSGTATIKATVAASDIYKETTATYTLQVAGYTPEAGSYWKETYSRLAKTSGYVSEEQAFRGDSLVYGWKVIEYVRDSKDEPFRIRTNGYIKMNGNQEGGIKYAQLNWMPSAKGNTNFTMAAGSQSYPFAGAVTKNTPYVFEHFFNIKENTSLSVTMGTSDISAYMQVVNITIVPYLLYTKKSCSVNIGDKFTNTKLIDNRDNADAITYEITKGSEYVDLDTSTGEVTGKAVGTATIQASWSGVTTTYQVTVADRKTISETDAALGTWLSSLTKDTTLNITLVRNLSNEQYNTICLPFAMDADQVVAAFGSGTKIAELTQTFPGETVESLDLYFEFRTAIVAGVPYLIQPANTIESVNVDGVTITNVTDPTIKVDNVTVTGVIGQTSLIIAEKYFLGDNNYLEYYTHPSLLTNPQTMNGMRAYFEFAAGKAPKRARCVFQHNMPTDMSEVGETELYEPKKLIIDGNLYIIREGKTYDAQGRLVK